MKQKNNATSSLITRDEKYINDPITVTNMINNFFTSIAETVQSKIKFSNKSFRSFLSKKKQGLFRNNCFR